MIASFSIANFRSINEEQSLNMVASKRLGAAHQDHMVPIPGSDESLVKTAVIYGANGAGKSNVFRALAYTQNVALQVKKKKAGTKRESFRLGMTHDSPSAFDLQFIAGERLYRYGFKANDDSITEEWLAEVKGERVITLYERITHEGGEVEIKLTGLTDPTAKLKALATVGALQNCSFLATIRANLKSVDYGKNLEAVIKWFEQSLKLVAPDSTVAPLGPLLANSSEFTEFAGNFMKYASTGVNHLHIDKKEITEEQLRSILPDFIVNDIMKDLEENQTSYIRLGDDSELLIELDKQHHFYQISIHANHLCANGKYTSFQLAEESDGTKRLLDLIPALHYLQNKEAVFVIDEIDRSMHPMLVWKFLEFFLKDRSTGRRQIIVTTHESNLLDLDLLRRDEIWFVEKDHAGATSLYPLTDFKVRQDLEIRKHYLQGRFGAVPFLGNLERLTECVTP